MEIAEGLGGPVRFILLVCHLLFVFVMNPKLKELVTRDFGVEKMALIASKKGKKGQ